MTLTSYLAQVKERLEKANNLSESKDPKAFLFNQIDSVNDIELLLLIVERQREALDGLDCQMLPDHRGVLVLHEPSSCLRCQALSDIEELLSEEE